MKRESYPFSWTWIIGTILLLLASASVTAQTVPSPIDGELPIEAENWWAVNPTSHDYGDLLVNTEAYQTFTLTNFSGDEVEVTPSISDSGRGFTLGDHDCTRLQPESSCRVEVRYSPATAATHTTSLTFSLARFAVDASVPLVEEAQIPLSGRGITPAATPPAFAPQTLDFGEVAIGGWRAESTTLTNSDPNHALFIQEIVLEGAAQGFAIDVNHCGEILEPGQSCTLHLSLSPSSDGPLQGALLLFGFQEPAHTATRSLRRSRATPQELARATLQGSGVAPSASVTLTPSELNFGSIAVGESSRQTLTLANSNDVHPMQLQPASLEGDGFRIEQTTCGTTLEAEQSCTFTLLFEPSRITPYGATLSVAWSDGYASTNHGTVSATLQGEGRAPLTLPPVLPEITPNPVEFGTLPLATTASASATLTNRDPRHYLAIEQLTLEGEAAGFHFSQHDCGSYLPPNHSCTLQLAFTPSAVGWAEGAVVLLGGLFMEEIRAATASELARATLQGYGEAYLPPITAYDDHAETPAETPITLAVLANDQGVELTLISVTTPANGSAAIENQQIRYTPAPGFAGSDRFRYTISDHHGQSASAQVTITVEPPPLTANDDQATTPAATPVTLAVLANDQGEGLTLVSVTAPAHGSAVIENQQIRYTPAPGFAGNDSFHYSISDRYGQSTSARVQVTVIAPELHARDDHAETPANTPMTLAVLDNDSGEGITITQLTSPQHGSVTHLGDETLHYTPALNFAGEDHFSYTIGDRYGQSASARVTLRVVAPQLQAIDDSAAAHSNTPVAIPVLANDIGQSITISEITSPQHGSATLQQDGTILYTSVALYSGSDSFRYTISDGISSDSAQVTVQVTPSREELEELLEQSSDDPAASRLGGSIARLCFDGSGSAHFQRDCEALIAAALERHQRGPGEPPLHPDDSDIGTILEQITPRSFRYPSETTVATAQAQMSGIQSRLSLLRSGTIMGIDIERLRIQRGGWAFTGQDLHDFLLASTGNVSSPPPPDSDEPTPFGLFIGGTIHLGDRDPGVVSGGYTSRALDLMIGGDYRISDPVVVGGALHYSESDTNYRQQEGQLDTRGYGLTLYSAYYPSDPIYLEGIIHYGTNRYDQQRNLSYRLNGDEIAQRFDSNYQGRQLFAEVGGGYEFTHGNLTFGPDARLGYLAVHTNRFQEQAANPGPGSGWAMALDRQRQQQQMLNLGVRASYLIEQPWGLLRPNAELTWQQHLDDRNNDTLNGYFVEGGNSPDNRFTFPNDPSERDNALRLGLGVNARLNNGASLHLRYRTLLGHDQGNQQSLSAQIRWNF